MYSSSLGRRTEMAHRWWAKSSLTLLLVQNLEVRNGDQVVPRHTEKRLLKRLEKRSILPQQSRFLMSRQECR